MNLDLITPLILTCNEEANIGRTLAALTWAKRIVVVDSGSTDGTLDLVKKHPAAQVFQRRFDTHARQWNFGLAKVSSAFTLSLDADYTVTPHFVEELKALNEQVADGWYAEFRYCIDGRPLRAALLPPRLVLFRTAGAQYFDDGHTQRLRAPSRAGRLQQPLLHDDRKPMGRWRENQRRYAVLEARKLRARAWRELSWPDRLRRLYLGPPAVLVYCLCVKRLLLEGAAGWRYTSQRFYAEFLIAIRLVSA